MGEAFAILLLIIIWVSLFSKLNTNTSKIDVLTKEINRLKDLLEYGKRELIHPNTEEAKEEVLPVKEEQIVMPPVPSQELADTEIVAHETPEVVEEIPEPPIFEPPVFQGYPVKEEYIPEEQEDVQVAVMSETVEMPSEMPPPPAAAFAPPPPATKQKSVDYEKYIGENLFGKIGILVLVIGMGLFVKYAIDKNWIDETLRTGLGFAAGIVLLFIAWKLHERYRTFSSLLAGGAFAIYYVTVAMAYHYYGLFSQSAAFTILIIVTLFMSGLALFYDRRELAIIALGGGFIAPFLVSSGSGNYLVLFTYVIILDLGMFFLSTYKKWGELPVICFVFTWVILFFYSLATDLGNAGVIQLTHLLIFSVSFFLIFLLSVVSIVHINRKGLNHVLLTIVTLNNFFFLGFVFWILREMNLDYNYKGAFTMFIAAVNLILYFWTKRKGADFSFLFNTLLGVALTFISITIPIQLKGTFITLFWASEMVLLYWLYGRYKTLILEIFSILLPVFTLGSLLLDMQNVYMGYTASANTLFINGMFATGIFTGLAYLACAWFQKRMLKNNTAMLIISCIVLYSIFILDFHLYILPPLVAHGYMQLFTALVLPVLTFLFGRKRFPMSTSAIAYQIMLGFSVFLFVIISIAVNEAYYPRTISYILLWTSLAIIAGHILLFVKMYYKTFDVRIKQTQGNTLYLSILSTSMLLMGTTNLLNQLSLTDELNAGFSITLAIAGLILMAMGMRLHLKILRVISLVTFGLVLVKLMAIDLWLLPTAGKVIVFILLGIILLTLSFLYQKLKMVLLNDDHENIQSRTETPDMDQAITPPEINIPKEVVKEEEKEDNDPEIL